LTPFSLADSISLNKKNFFRAPQWELKLALKIVMGFVVLYFLAAFIFLGIGGYSLLVKKNNEIEPILLISEVIGYYFAVDLLVRYFFQS
jgi:TRAP-type C4-dicarboxylate transport system permease small subunit